MFRILNKCSLFVVIGLLAQSGILAQPIDLDHFRSILLCELVDQQINFVRDSLGRDTLYSHPKLVDAAQIQADFIRDKDRLSHTHSKSKYKNPFSRVDAVGGEFYVIRENIAFHDVLLPIYDPKTNTETTITDYRQLAKAFVREWVKSKGHFVNLSASDITHVGTAVALDRDQNRIFICQVLGKPTS